MLIDLILLFLFAGVPYYIYFEKTKSLGKEKIFLLSAFLVICGMILSSMFPQERCTLVIVVAFFASFVSLYKAKHTTNLYKLSYYLLFFNAPMLIMFETKESILYGISLLVTLFGIYLMGRYYEKNYGSANYRSVSGITLVTPYAGLFLTLYLTTLALYPPFPNSLLFFNAILSSDTHSLWYLSISIIFFGNFLMAMRVMTKTVFGKPNDNVHYIDLNPKERGLHLAIFALLIVLSIVGLREILS
ncbi:MAG: hypothetical protein Q9M39_05900 [Sulfurovum sp.]|nr:hypothetical protein [Sulfurovum sp.]